MRLLIWLILGYLAYRILKGFLASREIPAADRDTGTDTYQDPVCGVYVAAEDAVVGRIDEKKIYFCSTGCLEKYRDQLQTKSQ